MRKIIAVDFDGTICTDAYPEIGEPRWDVINKLKIEKARGAALILWTCRCGMDLFAAIRACYEWGLEFDAVNENLPESKERWGNDPRKIAADIYLDDRAMNVKEVLI